MSSPTPTATRVPAGRPSAARRVGALGGPLLVVVLALGGTMAGCSSGGPGGAAATIAPMAPAGSAGAGPVEAAVPMGHMHMPTAGDVEQTWKARPAFVSTGPSEVQAAYAYALARPDVLQWLPCYCGCAAMGHRSNLDCFFQRREIAGSYVYEEHASYCDVCVKTANMAHELLREGKTITQVRAAVDATFGGAAPGTPTELPPAA